MLGNRKLIVDRYSEVFDLLKHWCDGDFYDLNEHTLVPGAIYVIGRTEFKDHQQEIKQWVAEDKVKVVLSNPAEGSSTLIWQCLSMHHCVDLVKSGQILLIGGGDMHSEWPYLKYECFLPKILDYEENLQEIQLGQAIFQQTQKPYKFLLLNGRLRSHRKYLIEYLDLNGLLDQGLWTWLDNSLNRASDIKLIHDGENLMLSPRKVSYLPPEYEVPRYRDKIGISTGDFTKFDLFNKEWGEIYLYAKPYIDTYFSVVTETVFLSPYSFRTEKIWKPIAMGHPWICMANSGYYKDLRDLGFQTFEHIIDESFDSILDNQDRIQRISMVIKDLCSSDLAAFLRAAEPVCKYNQQHLAHMRSEVRAKFPGNFFQFLKKHQWMT